MPHQEPHQIIAPQGVTEAVQDFIVEDKENLPKSDQFGEVHTSGMIITREVVK
jgi:hypothetical protein